MTARIIKFGVFVVFVLAAAQYAFADDGYRLWLRYDELPKADAAAYRKTIGSVAVVGSSETATAIRSEIDRALTGMLGAKPLFSETIETGQLIVGTNATPVIRDAKLALPADDGFVIKSTILRGKAVTIIASQTETGALYGVFHFLRLLQTRQPILRLNITEIPKIKLRMLNHWDNPDGSIERGYAGKSLWNWAELPGRTDPRLTDYARANASVGINAAVLNNVNASSQILSAEYIAKVAAIAKAFRPYGIQVFLSARFSAPIELGGLATADPFDEGVKKWWKLKADEIYREIPDFGGFLVKANSEGQPGPRTYNRNHVDGANMMAAALAPHGGVVIWRAFVYDMKPGYDRAGAAYENLQPFDGKFAWNAILQVKNGPIDFQPREPFHPLFGAMPNTNVAPELQITQEYLGFSNHFVNLSEMWREVLTTDTFARGRNSTVARVADGSLFKRKLTAIAGVANTGTDRNWTGHDLLQANWYAFGRLAWNHHITSERIAREWIGMTLTRDAKAANIVQQMMIGSHDSAVDYLTPLGLHHQMWGGHHYGPAPWWNSYPRDDWNPTYYNKADADGIGFDRTATGSGTVSQYFKPVRDVYGNVERVPEKFLLWFHHVRWTHRLKSGETLWDALARRYHCGVDRTRQFRAEWKKLDGAIDKEVYERVARKFAIQERDSVWWKDASLSYFQSLSKLPLPEGVEKPQRTLEEYKTIDLLDDFARGAGLFDENHK